MKELDTNARIFNPGKLSADGITGELFTGVFVEEKTQELKQRETGKKFTSKSFIFKDDEGKPVIINSTGHLNYLMKNQEVTPGDRVSVIYKGRDSEDRHQFKLLAA